MSGELREQVKQALQKAWNGYCADTGSHPDFLEVTGGGNDYIAKADFEIGCFAEHVAMYLNDSQAQKIKALEDQLEAYEKLRKGTFENLVKMVDVGGQERETVKGLLAVTISEEHRAKQKIKDLEDRVIYLTGVLENVGIDLEVMGLNTDDIVKALSTGGKDE